MSSPSPSRAPFGARLSAAMDDHGPLCVGIDPHVGLLESWGLTDNADGVREFGLRVVEAVGGRVAAVKPQAAFFERHGSKGVAALEDVIAAASAAGTLVIVDAKRGDIGSTMGAYAEAFLRDGSPLAGDALTVSPYLGFGSLGPAIDLALGSGRGLFVLCLTSNKEGHEVQHARTLTPDGRPSGSSVAATMAVHASAVNASASPLGSIGLVVGATIGDGAATTGTELVAVNGPLLAPGVGAQGAGPRELATVFGAARRQVLASASRSVLRAGPDVPSLRAAARSAADEARTALRD
jgi:orotidine-5'-phosphate decarboxylase